MKLIDEKIINQTIQWIKSVVIDCNFCPFAAKVIFNKSVRYLVNHDVTMKEGLIKLKEELEFLETHSEIETSFIIYSTNFNDFDDYLDLVKKAERLLTKERYEGIYQIASFHPDYCFAGAEKNDAANYI